MKTKHFNLLPFIIFIILFIFFDISLNIARVMAAVCLFFGSITVLNSNSQKKPTLQVFLALIIITIIAGELGTGSVCEHCARTSWVDPTGKMIRTGHLMYFAFQGVLSLFLGLLNMGILKSNRGPV